MTAGITGFYMFRMWFLTFTGKPRDAHVFEHAHESPDDDGSPDRPGFLQHVRGLGLAALAGRAEPHRRQHSTASCKFGAGCRHGDMGVRGRSRAASGAPEPSVGGSAGLLAGGLGVVFAFLLYYFRAWTRRRRKEQFPAVYRFLWNKWYFDELYSAIVVRPALVVARWCRLFDARASMEPSMASVAATVTGFAVGRPV